MGLEPQVTAEAPSLADRSIEGGPPIFHGIDQMTEFAYQDGTHFTTNIEFKRDTKFFFPFLKTIPLTCIDSTQQGAVYQRIWALAGSPSGDKDWGENHAFDNLERLFQALLDTHHLPHPNDLLDRLPIDQQNKVYGDVYHLSENRNKRDPEWGKNHAKDNSFILYAALLTSGNIRTATEDYSKLLGAEYDTRGKKMIHYIKYM